MDAINDTTSPPEEPNHAAGARMNSPDQDGGGAPPQTSDGSSVIHSDVTTALSRLPDGAVTVALFAPPTIVRPRAGPTLLDGLAAIYLVCKKATKTIAFCWRLREAPRAPLGWYEAARHIWHNPSATGTQYEQIIVWSTNPTPEPGRVWSISAPPHSLGRPLRLWRVLIDRYTSPGERILIPYAGAGNAPLSCQTSGRPFIAIEPNETLVTLANKRLGQRALPEYP